MDHLLVGHGVCGTEYVLCEYGATGPGMSKNLDVGNGTFTAYGCDLTDGYVRINADYTT